MVVYPVGKTTLYYSGRYESRLSNEHVFDSAGLSWRGNSAAGGIGGICQERAKFKNDGKVRKKEGSML